MSDATKILLCYIGFVTLVVLGVITYYFTGGSFQQDVDLVIKCIDASGEMIYVRGVGNVCISGIINLRE